MTIPNVCSYISRRMSTGLAVGAALCSLGYGQTIPQEIPMRSVLRIGGTVCLVAVALSFAWLTVYSHLYWSEEICEDYRSACHEAHPVAATMSLMPGLGATLAFFGAALSLWRSRRDHIPDRVGVLLAVGCALMLVWYLTLKVGVS